MKNVGFTDKRAFKASDSVFKNFENHKIGTILAPSEGKS